MLPSIPRESAAPQTLPSEEVFPRRRELRPEPALTAQLAAAGRRGQTPRLGARHLLPGGRGTQPHSPAEDRRVRNSQRGPGRGSRSARVSKGPAPSLCRLLRAWRCHGALQLARRSSHGIHPAPSGGVRRVSVAAVERSQQGFSAAPRTQPPFARYAGEGDVFPTARGRHPAGCARLGDFQPLWREVRLEGDSPRGRASAVDEEPQLNL